MDEATSHDGLGSGQAARIRGNPIPVLGPKTERSSEPEFVFRKIVVVLILWAWDWPRISLPGTPGTPTLGLQPESVTSNPLINGLA